MPDARFAELAVGAERTRLIELASSAMRGLAQSVASDPADMEAILFRWRQVFMDAACPEDPRVQGRRAARIAARRLEATA